VDKVQNKYQSLKDRTKAKFEKTRIGQKFSSVKYSIKSKVEKVKSKYQNLKKRIASKVKDIKLGRFVIRKKDKIASKVKEWKQKFSEKFRRQSSCGIKRKKRSTDAANLLPKLVKEFQPWKVGESLDDFIRVVGSLLEISSLIRNSENESELFDKCHNKSIEGTICKERLEFARKVQTTIGLEADLTTIEEIEIICKLNFIIKDESNR